MAFPTGWSAPYQIQSDHTKVAGSSNLTDFPALISSANLSASFYSKLRTGEINNGYLLNDANLQGYWRLESSGTDSGPNGYTLGAGTVPSYVSAKFGNGADFEASSSQYLTIADTSCPNLEITGSFTYSAWIKLESLGAYQNIMGKTNSANSSYHTLFVNSSNQARIVASGLTTNEGVTSSITMTSATWYHVCAVYDSANTKLKIFTNGVKTEVTASGSSSSLSTVDFSVGRGGEYNGEYFDGVIDDVAVFNRALTDGEVKAIYTGGADLRITTDLAGTTEVPYEIVGLDTGANTCEIWTKIPTLDCDDPTNLYLWAGNSSATPYEANGTYGSQNVWGANYEGVYHLQSSGFDSSQNGYTVAPGSNPAYVAGQIGNGGDFEATNNNRLTLANASCANLEITGSQTWSCWYKPESIGANQAFISKRQASSGTIRELYIETDGGATIYIQGLTTNAFVNHTTNMSAGTWYHVVGKYNSSATELSIWINGSKQSVTASGSGSASTGDFWLGISGYSTSTSPADGILDEARVYNGALSDDWITTEYNNQNDPASFWLEIGSASPSASNSPSPSLSPSASPSLSPSASTSLSPSLSPSASTSLSPSSSISLSPSSSASASQSPSSSPSSSISLSPSSSQSPSSSASSSISLSPSASQSPSSSESASPSQGVSPSASPSASESLSPSSSQSPSSSESPSPSSSESLSPSSSESPSSSISPSPSASESLSPSASTSPSSSISLSPSSSPSLSPSASPSSSESPTQSPSPSTSISLSPSSSESPTQSPSPSVSESLSPSASGSPSPSSSISPSPSPAEYVDMYTDSGNSYQDKYSDVGNTYIDKYREWT